MPVFMKLKVLYKNEINSLKKFQWKLNYNKERIEFVREPKEQDYGTVAVFKDLYGNLWDLVEYSKNQ